MLRISYDEMRSIFVQILLKHGMQESKAATCAEVFATNSLEGIYTHGVNRFSRFVQYIIDGHVQVNAEPILKHAAGSLEQWDGQLGPGPLNAIFATERAMQLAKQNGIGSLALSNTNHWMRGGYYAWQAAKKKCILISWTNTIGNMPAWGAKDKKLGNNPFVMGIPFNDEAIVLDMAMSQFAHGKLEVQSRKNEPLPVPGGFDREGKMTTDATEILAAGRMMPIGYWKGSGLSLLLDILAMVLSGGQSAKQVSDSNIEAGVSQVFIAIDMTKLGNYPSINNAIDEVIADYLSSEPAADGEKILYPGQRVLQTRKENLENGIPVEESIWKEVLSL